MFQVTNDDDAGMVDFFDAFPAWSPDGSQIVFVRQSTIWDGVEARTDRNIFVINSDGENLQQLTSSASYDDFPDWSPDGKQIVFSSDRDGDYEIFLMTSSGSHVRQLTNNDSGDYFPHWSPDGSQIIFSSHRYGISNIFLLEVDSNHIEQITDTGDCDFINPNWSPNGDQIVFDTATKHVDGFCGEPYKLATANSDGSNFKLITDGTSSEGDGSWSSGGSQIFFTSERWGGRGIFSYQITTGAIASLVEEGGSPDVYP